MLARDTLPELQLPDGQLPQAPGVIGDDVFRDLEPIMSSMPERRKY